MRICVNNDNQSPLELRAEATFGWQAKRRTATSLEDVHPGTRRRRGRRRLGFSSAGVGHKWGQPIENTTYEAGAGTRLWL